MTMYLNAGIGSSTQGSWLWHVQGLSQLEWDVPEMTFISLISMASNQNFNTALLTIPGDGRADYIYMGQPIKTEALKTG